MAYLTLIDGGAKTVPAEEGEAIWRILNNQQEPTKKQGMLCTNIKHVYLDWRNESTPDDYIRKHLGIIEKICISYFMVDRNGNPTKPEYHDKVTWNFVKKWNIPWR